MRYEASWFSRAWQTALARRSQSSLRQVATPSTRQCIGTFGLLPHAMSRPRAWKRLGFDRFVAAAFCFAAFRGLLVQRAYLDYHGKVARSSADWDWTATVLREVPLSPIYLNERLSPALYSIGAASDETQAMAVAQALTAQMSLEVAHLLQLSTHDRRGRLDGLMDLSPPDPKEKPGRHVRRRLYQALDHLVRHFLHDPECYLSSLIGTNMSALALRSFVADAIEKKRSLRRLCQSQVAFSTVPPSEAAADGNNDNSVRLEPSPDAAAVHSMKQWSKAFHAWCAAAPVHYFLLDSEKRERWLTGLKTERSRVTMLTYKLRDIVQLRKASRAPRLPAEDWAKTVRDVAAAALPGIPNRLRLLDVGSCGNYFGREHGDRFDVTAVDLAPAHPSVLACDILGVSVGPQGSKVETALGDSGFQSVRQLPAGHYDVAVMALLLSVLPSPQARGIAIANVRKLLRADSNHGLLIIADTAGAVGRHGDPRARRSAWVSAVEAAGFKLVSDPQMHQSKLRENGFWHRAFCWTFVTAPCSDSCAVPVLVPLRSDEKVTRALAPERAKAQAAREEKRRLRAERAALKAQLSSRSSGTRGTVGMPLETLAR